MLGFLVTCVTLLLLLAGYKLELQTGSDPKQVLTVQWYDNTKDLLPADLKMLCDVLLQTMNTSCGGTP